MTKYLIIFITAFICIACSQTENTYKKNGQNNIVYSPKKKEATGDYTTLKYKPTEELLPYDSTKSPIKISIWVPKESNEFNESTQSILITKLVNVINGSGIVGYGDNPCFILAVSIALTNEHITSTIPQQYLADYQISYSVVNIITQDIYSTSVTNIKGVGTSKMETQKNAISSLKFDASFLKMIKNASNEILNRYETRTNEFKNQVSIYVSNGEYDKALVLLKNVPKEATKCYQYATSEIEKVSKLRANQYANDLLVNMNSLIAKNPSSYDENIGAICKMIPANTPQRKEAESNFMRYVSNLSKIEQERITHERKMEIENLRVKELELSAEIETNKRIILETEQKVKNANTNGNDGFWPNFFNTMVSSLATKFGSQLISFLL